MYIIYKGSPLPKPTIYFSKRVKRRITPTLMSFTSYLNNSIKTVTIITINMSTKNIVPKEKKLYGKDRAVSNTIPPTTHLKSVYFPTF